MLVHRALAIAGGDLNPHFFNYPSLHLYLLAGLYGSLFAGGWLVGAFAGAADFLHWYLDDPSGLLLAGRALTALFGVATVAATWDLARTLGGRPAATPAALFLTVALLHVRDSHFLTVDVAATFWATAALAALARHIASGERRWLYAGAALLGLGVSTKYNIALFGPGLLAAIHWAPGGDRRGRLLRALGLSGAAFLAGSPFLVLDAPSVMRDILFEWHHFGRGHAGVDVGPGWWHHLSFTLRHGLGLPVLLAAIAGLVLAARQRGPASMAAVALASYFVVAGSGSSLFVRYALPMVPVLCALAVLPLVRSLARRPRWLGAAALLLAAPSLLASLQTDRLLSRQDTREQARHWIERHVPAGARIVLTGVDYGQPVLTPTRGWLQDRWQEAQRAGEPARRLRLRLERAAASTQTGHYPISLRPGVAASSRTLREPSGLAEIEAAGIDWLVTQDHPLAYAAVDPRLAVDLGQRTPVVEFAPAPAAVLDRALFDPLDAWYLPLAGLSGFDRPGPRLRIYRLRTP